MWTTQDKLNTLVKEYEACKDEMYQKGEDIDKHARELLKELMTIEGWECMIKSCYAFYAAYKNKEDFFRACNVTHTKDAVQFIKGYSDGDEYEVLEISFRKPLKEQVREKLMELQAEEEEKAKKKRRKELAELERLKKKYESK